MFRVISRKKKKTHSDRLGMVLICYWSFMPLGTGGCFGTLIDFYIILNKFIFFLMVFFVKFGVDTLLRGLDILP